MMNLALDSNRVLKYMHMKSYAFPRVGFERLKLFKDGLNHFLLVVMPKILP